MKISGFTKLTLIDYPNKLACIIFTKGCNYRCPFCHNSSLIKPNKNDVFIDEKEIFDYLKKRKGLLDGICISGGEPTIQGDLYDFLLKVKKIGYLIKLDTNGSNPDLLKKLIDEKLVDYIAMDIKNSFDNYQKVVNIKNLKIEDIKKSIKVIENSGIDYEFRTTIIKEYHSLDDILKIRKMLAKKSNYYLQNFKNSEGVIDKTLHGFSTQELEELSQLIKNKNLNIKIRNN